MPIPFRKIATIAACLLTGASGIAAERPISITGVEILERAEARFPATMRAIGVKEGHVSLVLSINELGDLVDTFVVESSRRAFAESAIKSVKQWTFAPAQYDGAPFPSTIRVNIEFELARNLQWQTFQAPAETNVTQVEHIEQPITANSVEELDSIPLPLKIVDPPKGLEGEATVEFYIDELGNVRCPRLVAGDDLAFGLGVLDSISQWRFQPPVANGLRTNTLVRQTFLHRDGKLATSKPR